MHMVECASQRGALLVGSKFQLVIIKSLFVLLVQHKRNSTLLIINHFLMSTALAACVGPCIPCESCKPYPYTDNSHAQSCICTMPASMHDTDTQDTDNLKTCVSSYCETSCKNSVFPNGNCQQECENYAWPITSCDMDKITTACGQMNQRTQSGLVECFKTIGDCCSGTAT